MGIKGLFAFLRKHHPKVFEEIPASSFSGLRIAVDAGTWLFPLRIGARKEVIRTMDIVLNEVDEEKVDAAWIRLAINGIRAWTDLGITPIIVFDGPSPPEKFETLSKRVETAEERDSKIRLLRDQLRSMDRLRVKNADVVKLRELEGQVNRADSSSKRRVMLALKNIGIPCLIGGEGIEAERLASSLVRANIAAAVYSADGDCLTHGCDLLIRDVGLDRQVVDPQTGELVKIKTYNIVRLAKVLHLMGVTFPTFVDVCIMAGCDYNSNLPNLAIGSAYPLLKEHGRIESIPSSNFSTKQLAAADDLRIAQCRRNFELLPFHQMFDMDLFARGLNLTREQLTIERAFNVYFNPNCLYESLSASSMGRYYTELSVSYSKLPQPKNYRNIVQVVSHHGEVGYDGDVELEGIVELQKDEEREHNIF